MFSEIERIWLEFVRELAGMLEEIHNSDNMD